MPKGFKNRNRIAKWEKITYPDAKKRVNAGNGEWGFFRGSRIYIPNRGRIGYIVVKHGVL
ncbi:hypothetical protein ACFL6S_03470 [Candidatus Poribacteria bacterium]